MSQDINYVNSHQEYSNSAYVRIKVFRKPIVAKMLVDSGNLVSDLISAEFANLMKAEYEPVTRKVGTAAKGGSVNIIGSCKPLKIFIENIPDPITIHPFVVKDLSHPINVGREFLGRYKGRLEFLPDKGFLEIKGIKTRLITKKEELCSNQVTDSRLKKVIEMQSARMSSLPEMAKEGMIHTVEELPIPDGPIPVYANEEVEIPAMSARFVGFNTACKLSIKAAQNHDLFISKEEEEGDNALTVPGVCSVIDGKEYGFLVNPDTQRVMVKRGQNIGTLTLGHVEIEEKGQKDEIGDMNVVEDKQEIPNKREWLRDKLHLQDNNLTKDYIKLQECLIDIFEDNWAAVSKNDFDYGHTDLVKCQIKLKPGEEKPV